MYTVFKFFCEPKLTVESYTGLKLLWELQLPTDSNHDAYIPIISDVLEFKEFQNKDDAKEYFISLMKYSEEGFYALYFDSDENYDIYVNDSPLGLATNQYFAGSLTRYNERIFDLCFTETQTNGNMISWAINKSKYVPNWKALNRLLLTRVKDSIPHIIIKNCAYKTHSRAYYWTVPLGTALDIHWESIYKFPKIQGYIASAKYHINKIKMFISDISEYIPILKMKEIFYMDITNKPLVYFMTKDAMYSVYFSNSPFSPTDDRSVLLNLNNV